MMSGSSTTNNYNFVDNNPYEVNTTLNLAKTYLSSDPAFSRGCCTEAALDAGTCIVKNKNP